MEIRCPSFRSLHAGKVREALSLYKWKTELVGARGGRRVKDAGRNGSSDDRDDLEHEVETLRKRIHRLQVEHEVQALGVA